MTGDVRKEIVFTGRVQGVGFRYTTRSIARSYEVTGFVRNMPDGSVHLVAEGQPGEVEAFVSALKARMKSYIRDAQESGAPPEGRFESFEIAF
jgi:acylphosphatase